MSYSVLTGRAGIGVSMLVLLVYYEEPYEVGLQKLLFLPVSFFTQRRIPRHLHLGIEKALVQGR